MSSTNRSNARDFHVSDYYKTPVKSILDFLMEFDNDNPELSFTGGGKSILDPCAGGRDSIGIMHQSMSYPEALRSFKPLKDLQGITTIDLRNDSLAEIKADYLSYECKNKFDVIITNPPFGVAFCCCRSLP